MVVYIYEDATDEELIERIQGGDDQAFQALYERYIDDVYKNVSYRIPAYAVDDLTQEIFLSVARGLPNFQGQSKFKTWVYTITRRRIADFYKARKEAAEDIDDHAHHLTSDSRVGDVDDVMLLKEALQQLPQDYQELILLRFLNGLAFKEIAAVKEETLDAVKSRYSRAMKALRAEMEDNYA